MFYLGSYVNFGHQIEKSDVLTWVRSCYITHVISPKADISKCIPGFILGTQKFELVEQIK